MTKNNNLCDSHPHYRTDHIIVTHFVHQPALQPTPPVFSLSFTNVLLALSAVTYPDWVSSPAENCRVQDLLTLTLLETDQINQSNLSLSLALFSLFTLLFFVWLSLPLALSAVCHLPLPLLISAASVGGEALPNLRMAFNEILRVRLLRPALESANMIFSVYLICLTSRACLGTCMCGRRGFVLHRTRELNIPKCNFLNVKRAGLAAHHSVGCFFSIQ